MKIKLISDLHLDIVSYKDFPPEDSKNTVLALIGDTCEIDRVKYFREFLLDAAPNYMNVLVIFGNHEYYGGSINNAITKFKNAIVDIPNVLVMDRRSVVLDGVTIIGATLWTDMAKGDPMAIWQVNQGLNDFHNIRIGTANFPYQRKFKPLDAMAMHKKDLEFIDNALKEAITDKKIVLTHHAPTYESVAEKYKGSVLNAGFVSDLSEFILDHEIDLWVHGHCHNSSDYMVGNTRVLANPRGYGKENQGNFDPNFVIEI
jgi:predicted phosphodiesterase